MQTRNEQHRYFLAVPSRPAATAEPRRDGADDAQPRRAGQCADRAQRHLLRAARQRRTDRQRGDAGVAAGRRLSGHARHPQRRAGRRLEARHRRGARRRRADFPAALACRAHLASVAAAGRRAAGGAVGDRAGGPGVDARRHESLMSRRARWRPTKFPASSRISGAARATPARPASTASNCTAPTAI